MRSAFVIPITLFATACNQAPEGARECVQRLSAVAPRLSGEGPPLTAIYTFDISAMDDADRDALIMNGLPGRDAPQTIIAENNPRDALVILKRVRPGLQGVIMFAKPDLLFRVSGGRHRSPGAAIAAGCKLLPTAKLRAIDLTSGSPSAGA